jgi:hypothetical protein
MILIDDTVEKGALCDNGNVVVLPTWGGPLTKPTMLACEPKDASLRAVSGNV